MNRRSPVRSVLAERRMFANGGMLPISTPMQNTMDQGQNKASGILASSTPLIDAVSQEILAPMTGGAMPMAQGGSVVDTRPAYVFQEGGGIRLGETSQFLPPSKVLAARSGENPKSTVTIEALPDLPDLDALAFEASTISGILDMDDVNEYVRLRAAGASQAEALNTMDKADSETVAETVIKSAPPPTSLDGYAEAERDANMRINESKPFQNVSLTPPPSLYDQRVYPPALATVPGGEAFDPNKFGPTLTAEEAQADLDNLNKWWSSLGPENQKKSAEMEAARRIKEANDNNNRQDLINAAHYDSFFKKDSNNPWSLAASEIILSGANEEEIEKAKESNKEYYVDVSSEVEGKAGTETKTDLFNVDAKREEILKKYPNMPSSAVAEVLSALELNPDADIDSLMKPGLMFPEEIISSFGSSVTTSDNPTERKAVVASFAESEDFDFKQTVADFKQAMPEYNEDNSGYLLMLLGASIMEGESDNWATNVGAGMRKVLPAFIKEEKDRKAFMRSVEMGAGKYALSKRDALENDRRVQERTRNGYFLDNDISFVDDNGNVVENFTSGFNRLNDRQVAAIQAQEGIELMPLNVWLKQIEAQNEAAKPYSGDIYGKTKELTINLAPGLDAKVPVQYMKGDAALRRAAPGAPRLYLPNGGTPLTSAYLGEKNKLDYFFVLSSTARKILDQPANISGFQSIFGKFGDTFRAYVPGGASENDFFQNLDPNSEEAKNQQEKMITQIMANSGRTREEVTAAIKGNSNIEGEGKSTASKQLAEQRSFFQDKGSLSNPAAYNTVLRMLAIQMAPILLGESGKTISDGDRRLIANALGLAETSEGNWQFISSAGISEDQLRFRLSLVQEGLRRANKTLDDKYVLGWQSLGYDIKDPRNQELKTGLARMKEDPEAKTTATYGGQTFKVEKGEGGVPIYTFGSKSG
jgi:hypothetical protein